MDETLLVPITVAVDMLGKVLMIPGIWMSPPPPTAASIAPAVNAKKDQT